MKQLRELRLLALLPLVCCTVALILSFLCLFAGSSKGFMEDYAIVTLNTSRIGENVIEELNKLLPSCDTIPKQQRDVFSGFAADITSNAGIAATAVSNLAAKTIASHSSTKPANIASAAEGKVTAFFSEIHSKATHVESEIKSAATSLAHKAEAGFCKDLNTLDSDVAGAVTDIAKHLGLHDFYSVHIMDWCEGYYLPAPVPNTTLPLSTIHKNTTYCSPLTAGHHFSPTQTFAQQLKNATHNRIDLTALHWPHSISNGLSALKILQKAVFVFYCLAITFLSLSILAAGIGVFLEGRLSCLINFLVEGLAALTLCLASVLVTILATEATRVINTFGKNVDVYATRGNGFLGLTWAATGLVAVGMGCWGWLFVVAWRREREVRGVKYG